MLSLISCDDTTVNTGPYIEAGPVAVSVTINSDGSTVLSGSYSQRIIGIGPVGVGWTVGFEKVISEAKQYAHTLFILWEDSSGRIWKEQYDIGAEFTVNFNAQDRVRQIKSDGNGNVIVAVEPQGHVP